MTKIEIPIDQPDASFGTMGDRYFGIYRLPHGNWRQLCGAKKDRLYFATAQEATRAAMAKVNAILFRPVTVERVEADPVAQKLAGEIAAFRDAKAVERAQTHRLIRRGGGRPAVIVENKRRRGA